MQDFKLQINQLDSLLTEKTQLNYDLSVVGKDVLFKSKTNEGIEVLLKMDRSTFVSKGNVQWKYCADPSSDHWVTRNSTSLANMTNDFYNILKTKMFDPSYLNSLKK